jgi:hypothetical protein
LSQVALIGKAACFPTLLQDAHLLAGDCLLFGLLCMLQSVQVTCKEKGKLNDITSISLMQVMLDHSEPYKRSSPLPGRSSAATSAGIRGTIA